MNAHQEQTLSDYLWIGPNGPVILGGLFDLGWAAVSSDYSLNDAINDIIASGGGQLGSEDGADNVVVADDHGAASAFLSGALRHSESLRSALIDQGILRR